MSHTHNRSPGDDEKRYAISYIIIFVSKYHIPLPICGRHDDSIYVLFAQNFVSMFCTQLSSIPCRTFGAEQVLIQTDRKIIAKRIPMNIDEMSPMIEMRSEETKTTNAITLWSRKGRKKNRCRKDTYRHWVGWQHKSYDPISSPFISPGRWNRIFLAIPSLSAQMFVWFALSTQNWLREAKNKTRWAKTTTILKRDRKQEKYR